MQSCLGFCCFQLLAIMLNKSKGLIGLTTLWRAHSTVCSLDFRVWESAPGFQARSHRRMSLLLRVSQTGVRQSVLRAPNLTSGMDTSGDG